jgi:hypothetical protein
MGFGLVVQSSRIALRKEMSDEAELVKSAVQGFVEGLTKPYSDLLQALFGPAAEEAGLMLKESVQRFRQMRRTRFFGRTQEKLSNAHIKPSHVSLKILIPIIDNASMEEDDDIQDIWANLLASAANPTEAGTVYPSFPTILKELTARDVKFLDALFTEALEASQLGRNRRVEDVLLLPARTRDIYAQSCMGKCLADLHGIELHEFLGIEASGRHLSMNTFERNNILVKNYGVVKTGLDNDSELGIAYSFTNLGACFVTACRGPQGAS